MPFLLPFVCREDEKGRVSGTWRSFSLRSANPYWGLFVIVNRWIESEERKGWLIVDVVYIATIFRTFAGRGRRNQIFDKGVSGKEDGRQRIRSSLCPRRRLVFAFKLQLSSRMQTKKPERDSPARNWKWSGWAAIRPISGNLAR